MNRFLKEKELHNNTKMLSRYIFTSYLFFVTCVFLSGCGALGRLDQVLINDIPAQKGQINVVQIIRENQVAPTNLRMELKQGDEIKTDSESTAIIWLQGGSKIILGPDTHIRLVNPNHIIEMLSVIGDKISKLFVEAKGVLQVNTDYVSAASEGTNFLVTQGPNNDVSVTVLEGIVRLESKANRFSPVRLTRFKKASVLGELTANVESIDQKGANTIIEWINRIESNSYRTNVQLVLPDVTGLPVHEAEQVLKKTGFFVKEKVGRITGREPRDTIVEQSPSAGSRINKGGSVILYFEAEPIYVPSLIGLTRENAIRILSNNKLSLGRIQERVTGTSRPDTVIEQTPPAHTEVPTGSKVNLVIESESLVMPNLVNMHIEEALYLIRSENLKRGRELKELTDRYNEGIVIRQSIRAGTRVRPGTAVDLTVAEAGVRVPHLENIKLQDADRILKNAGLNRGKITRIQNTQYSSETIISQRPRPGTLVHKWSAVDLEVAEQRTLYRVSPPSRMQFEFKQCTVPNLIGKNEKQAIEVLKESGFQWAIEKERYGKDVIRQEPGSNTRAPCGSIVKIYIGTLIY